MMDILNAILQMAYNKLYIPLLLLTTSSLSKIRMNDNLEFLKIPLAMELANNHLRVFVPNGKFPHRNVLLSGL